MGRNKIRIEEIQDKRVKHVTFNKRKKGIMKKAIELSVLCNAEIMLCITDESRKTCYIYHSSNDHLSFITNLIHNKQMKIEREFPSIQENSDDDEVSANVESDNNHYNKRKIVSIINSSNELRAIDKQTDLNLTNIKQNLKDSPIKFNSTAPPKNNRLKRAKVFTNLNYNEKYLRSYLINSTFNHETSNSSLNLNESDKIINYPNTYLATTTEYNNSMKNSLASNSLFQSFYHINNTYNNSNKFNFIYENEINRDINN